MTVAQQLLELQQDMDRVYLAGQQEENSRFWDVIQDFGNRKWYYAAFRNWTAEQIRPKYKVVAVGQQEADYLFQWASKIKAVEAAYFDLSGVTGRLYATFNACPELERIEDIGLPAVNLQSTFVNCVRLKEIHKLRCTSANTFTSAFSGCGALEDVTFEGVIGQNLDMKECPLNRKSIESIVTCLSATASGKTLTLKKSAVQKGFETADGANDGDTAAQWLALRAEKSNWTISLV